MPVKIMNSALLALVGIGVLAGASIPPAHSADGSAITDDQRSRINGHVQAERRSSVVTPAQFIITEGATLPREVELFWMAPSVGLNHLRYAVVDGRTLVVAPYTRRIVAVLE